MSGSPFVSAAELSSSLERHVLLDARTGPDARARYDAAHLPDARFIDLETDLASRADPSRGGRHPFPTAAAFAASVAALGVGRDDDVVVYDLARGGNAAARAWFMLRSLGFSRVRVLAGVPDLWARHGLVMTSEPATFTPTHAIVNPTWTLPTIDIDGAARYASTPGHALLDARSPERFRGESEPIDPVAGRIPGARNVFHESLFDADGVPFDRATMRARLDEAIGPCPDDVAVSCGSGVTACHLALVMVHAGLPMPTLYVGSFSEWCRSGRAVAKGNA